MINLIDKPNHQLSHSKFTIRRGGILFPIALFLQFLICGFAYPLFDLGLLIIGSVSFYDDLRPISHGITGSYSLVTILSLYFINETNTHFISSGRLIVSGFALLVYLFFNFRKKATCFAGDVGSVSMAFHNLSFLGFL